MTTLDIIQTVLLVILVDRQLILRDRHKIAIEFNRPEKYRKGYFAIWIYCKRKDKDYYWREGGKRLFWFEYGTYAKE